MANEVRAKVIGGTERVLNGVETVGDVARQMGCEFNHTATVNGEPADYAQTLNSYEFVMFAQAVKGGIELCPQAVFFRIIQDLI
jgi:hypothetical protein